jgi:hypothetical protein
MVVHAYNPSYSGTEIGEFLPKAHLGKSTIPYLKNKLKAKGSMVQVVECLPSEHKALISIPSSAKIKEEEGSVKCLDLSLLNPNTHTHTVPYTNTI